MPATTACRGEYHFSITGYFHHNDGAGVVAGPLGQSITTAQPYLDPNYAALFRLAASAATAMARCPPPAPR
jgi:hypothetical protein